jgi:histidyl-tRNA synthetase
LTEAFGRKDMGATGAAGGVERIVMALHKHGILGEESAHMVYVACASDEMRSDVLKVASALRNAGITTEYDMLSRPLRKQLDDASGKKASAAVIVAPAEYRAGSVIVRSLADGKEETHPVEKLPEALKAMLRA